MADTKALFTQRFEEARTALANGDEPAAAESLHWAIVAARTDPTLRRELASALLKLGKLSRKFGRAGEAEADVLLTEALAISEELFGRENAALTPVLYELSRLYLQQSHHTRAKDVLERFLAIARGKGEEHPDVATALSGLAFVKRKLGDDPSAEALYREALRIREKALEPNHSDTIGTLEQLSETCAARGNLTEALALLNRALPTREAALGPGHERVRAARSRVAKLELQIAIEADTSAAAAARAARDVTPTPIWLKPVSDTPANTPPAAVPSPVQSKDLEFLGDTPPQIVRPISRPRDRSKTPAVAAVAVVSLMASSIPTPSAAQIAISSRETAGSTGARTGRESGATHRDLVLADVVHAAVANADSAHDDWHSPVASAYVDSPAPARKKRTGLYASAGVAACAIAIAGLLMLRPRAGSGKAPVPSEMSVAQRTADDATPVTSAPATATMTVSAASAAAAVVGATRTDSLRTASVTTAPAPAVRSEEHAPTSAVPELRAPNVDVHVGAIDMPTAPAALSVDSILHRAMERQRASDTDRSAAKNDASLTTTATVDISRTSPKIIGRIPQPAFPEALLRSGPREGQVVVRFLVNELGRVDVGTMIVERSDNELFTDAVRDILPMFRFQPAHTGAPDWKPVSAWVSVPFRFTTTKR